MRYTPRNRVSINYSGDRSFKNLIQETMLDMTIFEIKAYVLGLILAEEMVPPSYALDEILYKDTGMEIQFKTLKQSKRFFSEFAGLWNKMAQYRMENKIYEFEKHKKLNTPEEIFKAVNGRFEELSNFMIGLAEGETHPESCPEPSARKVLEWVNQSWNNLEDQVELLKKKLTDKNCLSAKKLLQQFDQKWKDCFSVLIKGLVGAPS